MSEAHPPVATSKNTGTHPVSLAVWVVAGAVALIIAIILIANFAIGVYSGRSLEGSAAMTPEALARRIGPVAKLQFEGASPAAPAADAPKAAPVAAAAPAKAAPAKAAPAKAAPANVAPVAAAAPAKAGKPDGKKVYDTVCTACHTPGAAGAPKLGDKAAWAPRIKTGMDMLYASALKGKNAMPPKGGNAALPDADVKAAVDYLVAAGK
jgi:cytochrome c5